MKPELQSQLYTKYPDIFRDRTKSMQESCLHWGIETGDGWYDLLDHLCYALSHTYSTGLMDGEEFVDVQPPQVVADQVKEKFGSLRFYYHLEFPESFTTLCQTNKQAQEIRDRYSNYFDGIVHMAESMSERTCEETGDPGEMHVSGGSRYGWYKTLSREFAEKSQFGRSRNYVPVADLPKETDEIK